MAKAKRKKAAAPSETAPKGETPPETLPPGEVADPESYAKAKAAGTITEIDAKDEGANVAVEPGHLRARCRDPQRRRHLSGLRRWGPEWTSVRLRDLSQSQLHTITDDPLLEVEIG